MGKKLKDIKGLLKDLTTIICLHKRTFVLDKCKNHEECKDIARGIGEKEIEVDMVYEAMVERKYATLLYLGYDL